jgi:hypothetical protein
MRARAAVGVAALAALLALGGDAHGQDGAKYATPREAFAAVNRAAAKKDWKTVYQGLTPESGERLTGYLVHTGALIQLFAPLDKTGRMMALVRPLEGAFKKHGLTGEALRKVVKAGKAGKGLKEQDAARRKLARLVKDQPDFVAEVWPYFKRIEGAGALFGKPTLKGVKVNGDTAAGTLVERKGDGETSEPITFRKVDGGWRVELPISLGRRGPPRGP